MRAICRMLCCWWWASDDAVGLGGANPRAQTGAPRAWAERASNGAHAVLGGRACKRVELVANAIEVAHASQKGIERRNLLLEAEIRTLG